MFVQLKREKQAYLAHHVSDKNLSTQLCDMPFAALIESKVFCAIFTDFSEHLSIHKLHFNSSIWSNNENNAVFPSLLKRDL